MSQATDAYVNAVPRMLENLSVPRLGIVGPWGHMMPHSGVPGPAIGFSIAAGPGIACTA